MKKLAVLLYITLLPIFADAGCFWPEFKASYYHFNSCRIKDVYGSGAALVQGELNYLVCRNVILFADAGYMTTTGQRDRRCSYRPHLQIVPFTFGGKFAFPFECGNVYLGGGFRPMVLNIHNGSNYKESHVHRTEYGGVIMGGGNFFWNRFVLNPFVEYNFNKSNFHHHRRHEHYHHRRKLDLSGWAFGGGVGYTF